MPIYKVDGKKDGKQKYRVRIYYTNSNGDYRQSERTAYGLEEAKALEQELTISSREVGASKNPTLAELHEEYIASRKKSVRQSSSEKSQSILNQHVMPTLGDKRLSRLTAPVLQGWKIDIDNKNLALITRQNIYTEFRALLYFAVRMEYISSNPLLKVGNFKDAMATGHQVDFYTSEEYTKFISAAKQASEDAERQGNLREWHYYVFFALAFYTGMRKGEIHALRWADIHNNCITVSRSLTQKLKGKDIISPPKNKSSFRTLQMPQPLIDILAAHKERCRLVEGFSEESLICGISEALRDTTIEKHNIKYSEAAGIKKIRIHDFRHSHASLLASKQINIQEIARRLGHAKIEMTWNTYSHLYPHEEERAIEILNQIYV